MVTVCSQLFTELISILISYTTIFIHLASIRRHVFNSSIDYAYEYSFIRTVIYIYITIIIWSLYTLRIGEKERHCRKIISNATTIPHCRLFIQEDSFYVWYTLSIAERFFRTSSIRVWDNARTIPSPFGRGTIVPFNSAETQFLSSMWQRRIDFGHEQRDNAIRLISFLNTHREACKHILCRKVRKAHFRLTKGLSLSDPNGGPGFHLGFT